MSNAVKVAMRRTGLRIIQTRTLLGGIAHLRGCDRLPDVILLDLCLPDSSGLATLVAIVHEARSAPIVVFTGREADEGDLDTIKRGASAYLVKGETGFGDLSDLLVEMAGVEPVPSFVERTDSQVIQMVERVRDVMQG